MHIAHLMSSGCILFEAWLSAHGQPLGACGVNSLRRACSCSNLGAPHCRPASRWQGIVPHAAKTEAASKLQQTMIGHSPGQWGHATSGSMVVVPGPGTGAAACVSPPVVLA
jgi:hypothetical protein